MSEREHPHLRLVDAPPAEVEDERRQPGQLSFSFAQDALVMVLVDLTNASESMFRQALEDVQPDVVVDLRLVPRFDFGRLNRLVAFRMFENLSARYYDLPCTLGATDAHQAILNPVFMAEPLAEILRQTPQPSRVLVLLDDPTVLDRSLEVFAERMPAQPRRGWQVRRLADT